MLVGTLSIQNLFDKNVHHVVPLFQRPYVWEQELQWEPLWDDVRRLAERLVKGEAVRSHFLGATVHDRKAVPPGAIETRLVIDGQQRLTTLQLLLQAFEDVAGSPGMENYQAALHNLTRNNHPLRQRPQEDFKVWPTNADRDDFRRTLESGSPSSLKSAYGVRAGAHRIGRAIPDAYLYFSEVIREWLEHEDGATEHRVRALYSALYEHVRLVVIDLDQQDDAQLIFETLNARGTPLLAADLVKNALLQEVLAAKGHPEDLYNQYWKPFDAEANYWREEIGRGHSRRPRIDAYLQYYLTLKTKDEVPASHLYTAYKDFAQAQPLGDATQRLADLARYGAILRRLDRREAPPRVQLFLERLGIMDVGTAYPFLLGLFAQLGSERSGVEAVSKDVESFLVRRMVCRLSTRGYNRLFIDLIGALEGDPMAIPERVRAKLLAGIAEYDRWPDDEEFRRAWLTMPLYEVLTRPRLRLLLEALERQLRSKLAETEYVPKNLTVEHVMPQSWEAHWPLPPSESMELAAATRRRLIHTIGNLTLLNNRLNPLISNGPWLDGDGDGGKRRAVAEHSVLHLNHHICQRSEWTDKAITERSEELFALARSIWPRPASQAALEAA
jgi:hypothetical protein